MKNSMIFFALITLLSACKEFQPAVPQFIIVGKIENFDGEKIKLVHTLDEIEINVDNDGAFKDTIYDFIDGYYSLHIGKEYTPVYIKDGFDLFLGIDIINFDESVKWKGIGANENNYLASSLLYFENASPFSYGKMQEDTFKMKVDSIGKEKKQFFENYLSTAKNLDTDFVKYENAKIEYFAPLYKEQYQSIHRYYTKNKDFEVGENYYDYRKNITLERPDLTEIHEYTRYVNQYISNNIDKTDTLERAFTILRTINREIHDNKLKKFFIFKSAKQNMTYVKDLEAYWALVSFMVTDKREYKELVKIKKGLDRIIAGADSPLTSFKDENDKEYRLEDFKGKLIYIDCWAQWCAPCKREIPFLQKLEEQFAGREIVFLKISLDKDIAAWKKYIKENNLEDNAFILTNDFDSEFAKAYMITGIPRFILLDKNLKIINSKAPRPSSNELVELLEKNL